MNKSSYAMIVAVCVVGLAAVLTGCGKEKTPPAKTPTTQTASPIAQKTCPVMGGPIDKNVYVDYEGRRIYFCCRDCLEEFKKHPDKYIAKVDAQLKK